MCIVASELHPEKAPSLPDVLRHVHRGEQGAPLGGKLAGGGGRDSGMCTAASELHPWKAPRPIEVIESEICRRRKEISISISIEKVQVQV